MARYKVDWIINGSMAVEADSLEEAERIAQENIIKVVENIEEFKSLGPQAIQGTAELESNDSLN